MAGNAFEMLLQDACYALRMMWRTPGFTLVAVLSLALGIGANTAIFSLVHTIMLRLLPVQEPRQLVELLQKYPGEPRANGYWSRASFEHIQKHSQVFSEVTAFTTTTHFGIRGEGIEPQTVSAAY